MADEQENAVSGRSATGALLEVFPRPKPIIGTVHLLPLPGAPRYDGSPMHEIIDRAASDARAYVAGGVDGLIVENGGDVPFRKPEHVGADTVAALTAAAAALRERVQVPLGVNCLANAVIQSLAIAKAVEGAFVRANEWVNAYVANEGLVEGAAAEALRFRSAIRAPEIRIFADVHVKHGSHAIVADRSLAELTRDVEWFDADVLIATGHRTGDATRVEEIDAIKDAASRPVIVGSGLTARNAVDLLKVADGAIVGTAMKHEGKWWNPVDEARVGEIMEEVARVR